MRDKIDSCKYLYLRELVEPEDNALRVLIEEARADGAAEDIEILPGEILSGSRAIESDDTCRLFELVWPTYVCYSIRNESFCAVDKEEVWEGRLFCLYTKSHFLDYVSRATFASDEHPGPLRHWSLNCLNHVIDIVSSSQPRITCVPKP